MSTDCEQIGPTLAEQIAEQEKNVRYAKDASPAARAMENAILASLRELKALREGGEGTPETLPIFKVTLTSTDGSDRTIQEYPAVLKHDYDRLETALRAANAKNAEQAERIADLEGVEAATIERCIKAIVKRQEARWESHGYTEGDTNASYFVGSDKEWHEAQDEEDDDCVAALNALRQSRKEGE